MICTNCKKETPCDEVWDLSDQVKLCQMCWEEACSESWWEMAVEEGIVDVD